MRLLFFQNDSSMRGSFWHKNSLITHILFELQPIMIFSPVANFGHHPLELPFQQKIHTKTKVYYSFEAYALYMSIVSMNQNLPTAGFNK
jgi:hypothetical protein